MEFNINEHKENKEEKESRNMSLFSNVPQELFRIIFEYLTLKELMELENSFMNYNEELLSHFKSSIEGFTIKKTIRNDGNSKLKLNWIIDHKLFIEKLELYKYFRELELNILNQSRSTLKDIKLYNINSSSIDISKLGYFPSLNSVIFHESYYFKRKNYINAI